MGRMRATGMYRNVDFRVGKRGAGDAIVYERTYRLCTAEFERELKPKRAPYQRKTEWFRQMYPKKMPGEYSPRMSK